MSLEKPNSQQETGKEFVAERLQMLIDSAVEELGKMKNAVASGLYERDQCLAVEHKIRTLFLELANEHLRPDKNG